LATISGCPLKSPLICGSSPRSRFADQRQTELERVEELQDLARVVTERGIDQRHQPSLLLGIEPETGTDLRDVARGR
jgi:hypothetical protein